MGDQNARQKMGCVIRHKGQNKPATLRETHQVCPSSFASQPKIPNHAGQIQGVIANLTSPSLISAENGNEQPHWHHSQQGINPGEESDYSSTR